MSIVGLSILCSTKYSVYPWQNNEQTPQVNYFNGTAALYTYKQNMYHGTHLHISQIHMCQYRKLKVLKKTVAAINFSYLQCINGYHG